MMNRANGTPISKQEIRTIDDTNSNEDIFDMEQFLEDSISTIE